MKGQDFGTVIRGRSMAPAIAWIDAGGQTHFAPDPGPGMFRPMMATGNASNSIPGPWTGPGSMYFGGGGGGAPPAPAPKQGSSASQGGPQSAPGATPPAPAPAPQPGRGTFGYSAPSAPYQGAAPVAPAAAAPPPAPVAQAPAPAPMFTMQQAAMPTGANLPAAVGLATQGPAPIPPIPAIPQIAGVPVNPIAAAIRNNAAGAWIPGMTPLPNRRNTGVPLLR